MRILTLLTLLSSFAFARDINLTIDNTVNFRGRVDFSSMQDLQAQLLEKHLNRKDGEIIYLVINSPGGSISAGNVFINFAKNIPNVKTVCIFCASMAHHISQALPGERLGSAGAVMMAHRARGTISGQFEDGELEERLKLWRGIVRKMEKINADRIGISLAEYKKRVKDEWWSHDYEAKAEGVLDDIVNIKCSNELMKDSKTETYQTLFGPVTVTIPSCPLMI